MRCDRTCDRLNHLIQTIIRPSKITDEIGCRLVVKIEKYERVRVNKVSCFPSAKLTPDQIQRSPCKNNQVNDLIKSTRNDGLTLQPM